MKRGITIAVLFAGAIVAACSSSTTTPPAVDPQPQPPVDDPNALTLDDAIEECARLIGFVNAASAHVDQAGAQAEQQGKDEFEARAQALEAVNRTILESPYRIPDLQRISGFYVSILQTQAVVYREMGAAFKKGDKDAFAKASAKLDTVGKQEDVVVEELNVQCRGRTGDEPAPPAPPPSVRPPPAPAPFPAPSAPAPFPAPSSRPAPFPAPFPAPSAPTPKK